MDKRNFGVSFSGAIYKDDCPRERFIPIYLIVGGSVGLSLQLMGILHMIVAKCKETAGGAMAVCSIVIYVLIGAFSFAWFIAGE